MIALGEGPLAVQDDVPRPMPPPSPSYSLFRPWFVATDDGVAAGTLGRGANGGSFQGSNGVADVGRLDIFQARYFDDVAGPAGIVGR